MPSPAIDSSAPARLSPIQVGLDAARANFVPGLALSGVGVAILLGYYFHPPTRAALDAVADFRTRLGVSYAIISTTIVGGLIPVFIQQFMPKLPGRAELRHLPFYIGFWAYKGLETDLFYRLQAWLFGDEAALTTVVLKLLADQFIFTPLYFAPISILAYLWKDSGFSVGEVRRRLERHWFRERVVPLLISNWAVWMPGVCIIYAVPLALQVPIHNIVLCIWVLMLTVITARSGGRAVEIEAPAPPGAIEVQPAAAAATTHQP